MHSTIKIKIAPKAIVDLFNNYSDIVNIKFFQAINKDEIPEEEEHIPIPYEITIRHAEEENAQTLLTNAIKALKKS